MARPKRKARSAREASPDADVVEADNESTSGEEGGVPQTKGAAKQHKIQLERLKEKDPEFYQFLKEHDQELLDFDADELDEDAYTDTEQNELPDDDLDNEVDASFDDMDTEMQKKACKVITTEMVDQWCKDIKENKKITAVRSLLRAFRSACHYGDDAQQNDGYRIVSSNVFNKIMIFVLNEMDGILRELLVFPNCEERRETVSEIMKTKAWKNYGSLARLYLGNSLHVLNQMTDEQMVTFTLKRVKSSVVLLAAFPSLLRKYIKVTLHFWAIGASALQAVSFLFLRDLCVRLGSDCIDPCLKGIYKAYVLNCKVKGKYISPSKVQHLRFLGNCVAELHAIDLASSYQHAFVCIRQLAMILHAALSEKPKAKKDDDSKKKEEKGKKKHEQESANKKKEAYLKVYDWQFINCLELWTNIVCRHSSDIDFQHLAYPLTQIIMGAARLVPTARYLPIRLQCARMLNRISASTDRFIPVSLLLLDIFEMKELTTPPTGGVGKSVDLLTRKLVGKPSLKTRGFQEACLVSVIELLAEHLAQWSYSIAFFELSFIPLVRLRSFLKTAKLDIFRKEIKELIRQVEANSKFVNAKRAIVNFSPNDPAATAFLQDEKASGISPLSQHFKNLRLKSQHRSDAMVESSVIVGAKSSVFGKRSRKKDESDDDSDVSIDEDEEDEDEDEEEKDGASVFSSSWLPDSKVGLAKSGPAKHQTSSNKVHRSAEDEDVVEDLVLSSDDDEPTSSITSSEEKNGKRKPLLLEPDGDHKEVQSKKRKRIKKRSESNRKQRGRGKRFKKAKKAVKS